MWRSLAALVLDMVDNAEQVRRLYEAAARGDFRLWDELLHEGVEWHTADDCIYFGPFAVLSGLGSRIRDFDGFAIDIHRIISAGDTVVVQARYRGIAKATGKMLDAQAAHIWDLRDGKIVCVRQYTDTWQFIDVSGVRHGDATAEPRATTLPRPNSVASASANPIIR